MKKARILKSLMVAGVLAVCVYGLAACNGDNDASGGVAATVNGVEISEQTVTDEVEHVRSQSGLSDDEQWGKFLVQNDMTPSSVRDELLDTLVEKELIKEGAGELGVVVESSEVEEAVNNFKENYSTDEAWQKALETAGFTEESYFDEIEESMIESKVGDHFEEEAEVTDEDYVTSAKTYASYYDGAKYFAQILFGTSDSSDESAADEGAEDEGASDESASSGEGASAESASSDEGASDESASAESASAESASSDESASAEAASSDESASSESASDESASSESTSDDESASDDEGASDESDSSSSTSAQKAQANEVLAQINAGTLDFAEAARLYSTDSDTAENGGEMGWDKLLELEDEYTDALTDLEVDQVSEVIDGPDGPFILKVLAVYDAPEEDEITSLDQIPEAFQENIKDMAVSVKANSLYTDWLDGLKDAADIQKNDMPSGLPYDIDLTPYQTEEDDAADDATDESSTDDATADEATADDVAVETTDEAAADGEAVVEDSTETGEADSAAEATTAEDAAATDAAAEASAEAEATAEASAESADADASASAASE